MEHRAETSLTETVIEKKSLTESPSNNNSMVWNSFSHAYVPDAVSIIDNEAKTRNRRHPVTTSSSVMTIDAYVDNAVIIKLDRTQYLDKLKRKESIESHVDPNPVQFFPSLDGKPR